jgi:hypothetical protein
VFEEGELSILISGALSSKESVSILLLPVAKQIHLSFFIALTEL